MRLLFLLTLGILSSFPRAQAQDAWSLSAEAQEVFQSRSLEIPEGEFAVVTSSLNSDPDEVLSQYLASKLESDQLALFRPISSKVNNHSSHYRYQQHCGDIPIEGRYLKVSIIGGMSSVQGSIDEGIDCGSFGKADVSAGMQIASSRLESLFVGEVVRRSPFTHGRLQNDAPTIADFGAGPELVWKSAVTNEESDWTVFTNQNGALQGILKNGSGKRGAIDQSLVIPRLDLGISVQQNVKTGPDIKAPVLNADLDASTSIPLYRDRAFRAGYGLRSTVHGRESELIEPQTVNRKPATSFADGTGYVFLPDPLASSGQSYGGVYSDNDDTDTDALNNERRLVSLEGLTQLNNGKFVLSGPWVDIVGESAVGAANYTVPQEDDPDDFRYLRSNDRFEAVNVYYHMHESQEYLEQLGFTDLQRAPIQTNPLDGNNDQSSYFFFSNFISFGAGGIDDAEDASIIWHEYAHAIMESASPGLYVGDEGFAFHEGWADYWAASYQRGLFDNGELPSGDWWRILRWDGNAPTSGPRDLTLSGETYPEYLDQGLGRHAEGLIWGTTMMEVYTQLGKEVADKLHLQANYLLEFPVTMASAARSVILADVAIYNGANANTLISIFSDVGFVDPSEFGPILSHVELEDREDFPNMIDFKVNALGAVSPIEDVFVNIKFGSGVFERYRLVSDTDLNSYVYQHPGPSRETNISYYFESSDLDGRVGLLPSNAPDSVFSFFVGPDYIPPTIEHNPSDSITLIDWPPIVSAVITDNISIDLALVDFWLIRNDEILAFSKVHMTAEENGRYTADVPFLRNEVEAGDQVRYRIFATDESLGNRTYLPLEDDPPFEITIADNTVLYAISAENQDPSIELDGAWQRGKPNFGLEVAYDGQSVFGTNLETAYPAIPSISDFKIGPFDTSGFDNAHLVFRHWYDTEFNRSINVDSTNGHFLWDGGNLEASIDGGNTWTLLEPNNGYSGKIFGVYQNPLGDQMAFGGNSYGWQKEFVPLPESQELYIRFRFGTDSDNRSPSKFYAGWYLDNLRILSEIESDDLAPLANGVSYSGWVDNKSDYKEPAFSISATDPSGIDSTIVFYEIHRGAFVVSDTLRMDMDLDSISKFSAHIDTEGDSLEAGDLFKFHFRLVDEYGNSRRYPVDFDNYTINYQRIDISNRLSESTATGAWTPLREAWSVSPLRHNPPTSSLLPPPILLADNANDQWLKIEHEYALAPGAEAFLSLSIDFGETWIVPDGGSAYQIQSAELNHGVWSDTAGEVVEETSYFPLGEWMGETVQVRFDFYSNRGLSTQEFWTIRSAELTQRSLADEFNFPQDFDLLPNYPDPSSISTTVSYIIDEVDFVKLTLYDSIGRAVKVLDGGKKEIGTYQLQVDVSDLAPAVYFLLLESEDRGLVKSESVTVF